MMRLLPWYHQNSDLRTLKKCLNCSGYTNLLNCSVIAPPVTVNRRGLCGAKYMIVIKCKATGYYHAIFLATKCQSTREIQKWIQGLRADPMFQNTGYKPVRYIETDSAGEWSMQRDEWPKMELEMEFETVWSCPDRKEEAAMAERACGVTEVAMKAGLFEPNLPPSWWGQGCYASDLVAEQIRQSHL